MTMDLVSVLIPARNEPFLQKTIESVLEAAAGPVEIIAVCDGYWPEPPIKDHPAVNILHYTEPIGQRAAVNQAARIARGKYLMKLDAHCAVGPGFDRILAEDCRYEWTVVPRMHNLDITTFRPKFIENPEMGLRKAKVHDYMYISSPHYNPAPFRTMYYGNYLGTRTRRPKSDKLIDETMSCMGPGWFMHKDRFWELDGLDEAHGGWGQMGIEVALKAWLSGGALMVNKKTWFAHWFRGGLQPRGYKGGFPYHITLQEIRQARAYSRRLWLENKWPKQIRTVQWLARKFNAPTWLEDAKEDDTFRAYATLYRHIHRRKNDSLWRGVPILKLPTDLMTYHMAILDKKPDWIVEIGTKYGGSAIFFQDMLDMCGSGGRVLTIDVKDQVTRKDPRIVYLLGNSIDGKTVAKVKETVSGKVMVVLDGNHDRRHVKWELHKYSPLVSKGQYLVVEDCYTDKGLYGPGEARDWFLERYKGFRKTDICSRYLVGVTMGGWLERTE